MPKQTVYVFELIGKYCGGLLFVVAATKSQALTQVPPYSTYDYLGTFAKFEAILRKSSASRDYTYGRE